MSETRYATARQHYICAGCHKRIARGTLYAYALDSRKRRTRYTEHGHKLRFLRLRKSAV